MQSKPILKRAIYQSLFSDYVFSFVNAGIKQDFQQYLGGLDPRQIQQLMKIMFDIRQVSKNLAYGVSNGFQTTQSSSSMIGKPIELKKRFPFGLGFMSLGNIRMNRKVEHHNLHEYS